MNCLSESRIPDEAVFQYGSPGNPVILFLHGFLGRKEDWNEIISSLSTDFRSIATDLPGHGENHPGNDRSYTMSGCAGTIMTLLDDLNLPDVRLVGYSMGGRLALYLAVNHPGRFSRVVIESASPGLREKPERSQRVKQDEELAERILHQPAAEFIHDWYNQPLFAGLQDHREQLRRIVSDRQNYRPEGLIRSLRGMGTGAQPSLWNSLGKLSVPICFIAGEDDEKFMRTGREMADLCPSSRLHIIRGSSHVVHMERPIEFAKVVRSFLT